MPSTKNSVPPWQLTADNNYDLKTVYSLPKVLRDTPFTNHLALVNNLHCVNTAHIEKKRLEINNCDYIFNNQ